MKLGFLQVYNEVNWIGYAIEQALQICDNLLICEGSQFVAFPDIPERSTDGTLDIITDKKRQYPKQIEIINTTRKHGNYRLNQCANFNLALGLCNIGDYFIQLDADEFFTEDWIGEVNGLMAEGKVDAIYVNSYSFVFSFKWRMKYIMNKHNPNIQLVKKVDGLHFAPTHKYIRMGKNKVTIPGIGRYHYSWLKPRERMQMRMRTSNMYPNMLNWFEDAWDNLELKEGKEYRGYSRNFILYRYGGEHPPILANHPWQDVEDIRKIK